MSSHDSRATVAALSQLLGRALRAFGPVGADARHEASELAAEAWALLHEHYPDAARRMDGVLHYLNGPRFSGAEAARKTEARRKAEAPRKTEAEAPRKTEAGARRKTEAGAAGPAAADRDGKHPWLPAPDPLETDAAVEKYFREVDARVAAGDDFDMEVRHLLPAHRHALIVEAFEKLSSGQGFVLVNDHDPKPLYYQFVHEYTDRFTWNPLEEGPDVWRVHIGKR